MDIQAITSKKVAGIPVVYIAAVVAVVAVYAALKMKPTPEDVPTEEDVSGDTGDDNQPVFIAHPPVTPEAVTNPTAPSYSGYSGPASKQGEPPVRHVVAGKSDDTYSELARLYYGLDNGDTRGIIAAANPSLLQPLPPGQGVVIPKRVLPRYYTATSAVRTLYAIARKNGTTAPKVQALNPNMHFPVRVGTRVRVA